MRRVSTTLQLRLLLGIFFLALSLPTVFLVQHSYSQLKWESFYQYRSQAEELSGRINDRFQQLINAEESRPSSHYHFLVVSGASNNNYTNANYLQLSPLSRWPINSELPGLIGYFQLDHQGRFSTPLLPEDDTEITRFGITTNELVARQQRQKKLQTILHSNQLAQTAAPALEREQSPLGLSANKVEQREANRPDSSGDQQDAMASQVMEEVVAVPQTAQSPPDFDRFKGMGAAQQQQKLDALSDYGRVEDLNLARSFDDQQDPLPAAKAQSSRSKRAKLKQAPALKRAPRKEQSALAVLKSAATQATDQEQPSIPSPARITMFESEVDPFDFALLDSGHFVLYRNVWRNGQRNIQGAIVEQRPFLQGLIKSEFQQTGLSDISQLRAAYQGSVFSIFKGSASSAALNANEDAGSELLHQSRLSAPFSDLELIYSIHHLPAGRGATVIVWAAVIIALVLCAGLLLMYRLGQRQIELSRQQQDFVSSVSHELKTPLTSIRMYSEILREGWADEAKRRSYYDFIFDESERLSRLIANVLQLARMNRNDIQLDIKPHTVSSLFDKLRSKISSQIEAAGFSLNLQLADDATQILADEDAFTQILINLVDNAIKFSSKSDSRNIDISVTSTSKDQIVVAVRDYGPGIPNGQMKKIFQLFYRSENELTRETLGTGIGLALVSQLVQAMGGAVDVINREPGAEFRVTLSQQ